MSGRKASRSGVGHGRARPGGDCAAAPLPGTPWKGTAGKGKSRRWHVHYKKALLTHRPPTHPPTLHRYTRSRSTRCLSNFCPCTSRRRRSRPTLFSTPTTCGARWRRRWACGPRSTLLRTCFSSRRWVGVSTQSRHGGQASGRTPRQFHSLHAVTPTGEEARLPGLAQGVHRGAQVSAEGPWRCEGDTADWGKGKCLLSSAHF